MRGKVFRDGFRIISGQVVTDGQEGQKRIFGFPVFPVLQIRKIGRIGLPGKRPHFPETAESGPSQGFRIINGLSGIAQGFGQFPGRVGQTAVQQGLLSDFQVTLCTEKRDLVISIGMCAQVTASYQTLVEIALTEGLFGQRQDTGSMIRIGLRVTEQQPADRHVQTSGQIFQRS